MREREDDYPVALAQIKFEQYSTPKVTELILQYILTTNEATQHIKCGSKVNLH